MTFNNKSFHRRNGRTGTRNLTREPRLSWKEVRDQIRADILDRTYAPGDKLPRDADIAETLGCARSTVQRAMRDLSDAGLIERKRKGGTHVRTDPVTRATLDIPITRREVERRGSVYGYQLIDESTGDIPHEVARKFEQTETSEMLRVKALHLADHKPHIFEDRWICTDTVPEFWTLTYHAKAPTNGWSATSHTRVSIYGSTRFPPMPGQLKSSISRMVARCWLLNAQPGSGSRQSP